MIKNGFRFKVKYVKHQDTKIGTITKFQIGDRIKGGEGYINYNVTAFEDIPLEDGDNIKLTNISSLEVREYTDKAGNKRKSFDIVADVEPDTHQAAPQATPQAEDEYTLPFDI